MRLHLENVLSLACTVLLEEANALLIVRFFRVGRIGDLDVLERHLGNARSGGLGHTSSEHAFPLSHNSLPAAAVSADSCGVRSDTTGTTERANTIATKRPGTLSAPCRVDKAPERMRTQLASGVATPALRVQQLQRSAGCSSADRAQPGAVEGAFTRMLRNSSGLRVVISSGRGLFATRRTGRAQLRCTAVYADNQGPAALQLNTLATFGSRFATDQQQQVISSQHLLCQHRSSSLFCRSFSVFGVCTSHFRSMQTHCSMQPAFRNQLPCKVSDPATAAH